MTTDTHKLLKVRKGYLDSLNDTRADTGLLRKRLDELRSSHPVLFDAHESEDSYDAIDGNPLNWTDHYFSRQKKLAERNFSVERLNHLIQVRDRFRQEGRKGFVPNTQELSARPLQEAENGYRPSNNLRKFVEEGDLLTLRTTLSMELEDSRLDAATLRSALAWAKARVPNLCEPYEKKAFARAIEEDRLHWTADYYGKQAVYLDTNFAEERFLHLVDVREHLRRQEAKAPGNTAADPLPTSAPRPSAKPAPAAGASAAQQPSRASAPRSAPSPQRGLSPALKAALLFGGALAAVAILLLALRKQA